MDFNKDPDEPPTLRARHDSERDPLRIAERLAEEYDQLSEEYEVPGGARDRRNMHAQDSYRLAFYYHLNPDKYVAFRAQPYFSDVRQKPHAGNIMLSVLKFTMRAKRNKQRLNRLYKLAPALEYLRTQDVLPEHVADYLKMEGGADCIYERLNEAKRLRRKKMFAEYERDRREAEIADFIGSQSQSMRLNAPLLFAAEATENDPAGFEPDWREACTSASREQSVGLANDSHLPNSPKPRRLNVRDLDTELIVEMDPYDLELVLNAVAGRIFLIVERADERGWKRVRGEIVSLQETDDHSSASPSEIADAVASGHKRGAHL